MRNDSAVRVSTDEVGLENTVPPWEMPWWKTRRQGEWAFGWIIGIHVLAFIGLILYPIPGWRLFLGAIALAWIGGIGTTVCYHRAFAHRALKLDKTTSFLLTIFAVANGSGAPLRWVSIHRHHHAVVDTDEDVSSPRHGFWWSHLRWLWQVDEPDAIARYCPEMNRAVYARWRHMQGYVLALSLFGPLYWGWAAFFWLGAIRLVFALHAQCFVNSVCHTEPGIAPGEDSSRNVGWLAPFQLLLGENWHRNHHARAGSARLGWNWRQPDAGYWVICLLERFGLATDVRHLRSAVSADAKVS
ncbi:MAG TPA: fatty acid desaturase [Candidatus Binataceae bacterium]|nr:fatty acid desaturase [Candidatus Binataceae bacterium]